MKLILKQGKLNLFAYRDGVSVGSVIAESGDITRFHKIYQNLGQVFHKLAPAPNPFFIEDWADVFDNPELLPIGTVNVLIEESQAKYADVL